MATCKNCNAPIEIKQGRRPREFCDNNQKCRNEYFRKNKKEKAFKTIPIEQWNEIEKKLAVREIKIQDANNKTNIVEPDKPMGSDKTNFTINTEKSDRISQLEKELNNIPAKLKIPKAMYISIRKKELAELKDEKPITQPNGLN